MILTDTELTEVEIMVDFTTVCGVDSKHFQQLCWTWPTWKKWKPNILNANVDLPGKLGARVPNPCQH